MTIAELYAKAGGREKAAELCGVSTWATYKWDTKGIPPGHWRTFADHLKLGLEDVAAAKVAEREAA
jgi:hypothetical protein